MTVNVDYSHLIGFIYSNDKLHNKVGFAKYLGITNQAMSAKLNGLVPFNQREILKVKIDFNLSDEQVGHYFFTPKLQKENKGE